MISITKDGDNSFMFEVKAASGQTLVRSVPFANKKAALKTVERLSTQLDVEHSIRRQTTTAGKFVFKVQDKKGGQLASSGLYSSEAGMENGIKNFRHSLSSSDSGPLTK
ncbi:hypothetical protein [Maribacter sp. 2307ULW6-5]|uniref:hypothetical protein n=1 Tax=Maribacter sp. 2307ULW6-5 TaxID=3386275 RepID=UPI0039BCBCA0